MRVIEKARSKLRDFVLMVLYEILRTPLYKAEEAIHQKYYGKYNNKWTYIDKNILIISEIEDSGLNKQWSKYQKSLECLKKKIKILTGKINGEAYLALFPPQLFLEF